MARTTFFSEGPLTYMSPVQAAAGVPLAADVTAEQYLEYAKLDLQSRDTRGAVNALGNAKRCMHLMIDGLLQNYGLLKHSRRLSFPAKMRLLDSAGLIALNIFNRLNVARNLAEHEYQDPDPGQVQDFIDVCQLLLLATESLSQDIPYDVVAGVRKTGEHVYISLEPLLGRIEFRRLNHPDTHVTQVFDVDVEYVLSPFAKDMEGFRASLEPEPFDVIDLKPKNQEQWSQLLQDMVSAPGRSRRISRVNDSMMTIWFSKTFPVNLAEAKPLAELMRDL